MSALARLLARAGGGPGPAPGLRPRLPFRFEAPRGEAGDGFETLSEREAAAPATQPGEEAGTRAAPHGPENHRLPPGPPDRDVTAKAPPPALSPVPPGPPPVAASSSQSATPSAPPRVPDPVVTPDRPRRSEPASGATARPNPANTSDPEPPPLQRASGFTEAPRLGPQPAPLQPSAAPRTDPAPHRARAAVAPPQASARQAPAPVASPEPPEITVHIGRLHVVTEASGPRLANERPRPRRASAALGAYLRGQEDDA